MATLRGAALFLLLSSTTLLAPTTTASEDFPEPPTQLRLEVTQVNRYLDPDNYTIYVSTLNLTYTISADDPQECGVPWEDCAFTYRIWKNSSFCCNILVPTYINQTAGTAYEPGTATADDSPDTYQSGVYVYHVTAFSHISGNESAYSCPLYINIRINGSFAECGISGTGVAIEGPTFPGLDIDEFSNETGLSINLISGLLGIGLAFGLLTMGYMGAGTVGGVAGGALGLALIATLGLMPLWALVLIIMAAAVIIVAKLRTGGGTE